MACCHLTQLAYKKLRRLSEYNPPVCLYFVRAENVTFGVWDNKFPIIGYDPMCQLRLETLARCSDIGTFYLLNYPTVER